ncbi:MAG: hypothetical protein HOE14_10535 [Gemmatimonadales bacterium]|jgi:hypothetical protein|nr:hypothetical protein [Gemmatimonadales bacterium]
MLKRFTNIFGDLVTFALIAVLGGTFVLGVILPADKVNAAIIDWKATVASEYFSNSSDK